MKKLNRWWLIFLLILAMLTGCTGQEGQMPTTEDRQQNQTVQSAEKEIQEEPPQEEPPASESARVEVEENGHYQSKEEVAQYLREFSKLPSNYITKKEAMKLGWKSKEGNLWEVADGKSIGGDVFGNREKRLPQGEGRTWYECDIDYRGGFRNEKRIVYSDDGLIYYTADHYKTFEKLE